MAPKYIRIGDKYYREVDAAVISASALKRIVEGAAALGTSKTRDYSVSPNLTIRASRSGEVITLKCWFDLDFVGEYKTSLKNGGASILSSINRDAKKAAEKRRKSAIAYNGRYNRR